MNTGPHGMAARVRWLLSPGRDAIVVVEDAVGVEAEPVPDGFVFASERTGAVVQVDGVWDVAPSPDWTRLAVARAFVFRSGESDTIPTGEWERLFAWLPEDVAAPSTAAMRRIAERYTFPASGMSYARALGLTQVVDVGGRPPGRAAFVAGPAVRLEGWRVRWTPSGDTLAVGAASAMVQDDAPPSRWTLVRPRDVRSWRDSLGVAPQGLALHEVRWTEGPTLDVSLRIDTTAERRIAIGAGEVVSRNGSIERRANGVRQGVGRGVALAATTSGRFIAALAPVQGAGEFDLTHRVVVYEVVP